MRLIDADALKEKMKCTNRYFNIKFDINEAPTIDPETLPIVQELRKQIAEVKAERDAAIDEFENVGMFGDCICRYCGCAEKCNVDAIPEYCQNFYWRGLQEAKKQ